MQAKQNIYCKSFSSDRTGARSLVESAAASQEPGVDAHSPCDPKMSGEKTEDFVPTNTPHLSPRCLNCSDLLNVSFIEKTKRRGQSSFEWTNSWTYSNLQKEHSQVKSWTRRVVCDRMGANEMRRTRKACMFHWPYGVYGRKQTRISDPLQIVLWTWIELSEDRPTEVMEDLKRMNESI